MFCARRNLRAALPHISSRDKQESEVKRRWWVGKWLWSVMQMPWMATWLEMISCSTKQTTSIKIAPGVAAMSSERWPTVSVVPIRSIPLLWQTSRNVLSFVARFAILCRTSTAPLAAYLCSVASAFSSPTTPFHGCSNPATLQRFLYAGMYTICTSSVR